MKDDNGTDTIIHLCIIGLFVVFVTIGVFSYFSSNGNQTINQSAIGFINGSAWDHVSFNFTSDTFGIQHDIEVSVIAIFDPNYISAHPDVLSYSKLYVYLPNSSPKYPTYEQGHYLSQPIELDKQSDGTFRSSMTTIQYVKDGDMCYILSTSPNLYSTPSCLPNAQPIIHISSPETINQSISNRNMEFLTWVILAFTVLIVGEPVKNMVNNFSTHFRKSSEGVDSSKKEEKPKDQKQIESTKSRSKTKQEATDNENKKNSSH